MAGLPNEQIRQMARAALLICTAWAAPTHSLCAQGPDVEAKAQPATTARADADTQALLKTLRDAIRLLERRNTQAAIEVLQRLHDEVESRGPKGQKPEDPNRAFMKRIEAAVEAGTMTREEANEAIRDYRVQQLRKERRSRLDRLKKRGARAKQAAERTRPTAPQQPKGRKDPGPGERKPTPSAPDRQQTQPPPGQQPASGESPGGQ